MRGKKLRFQKADGIVIAGVLLLAVLVFVLFLPKTTTEAYAEIYQNGTKLRTVSLAQAQEFTVEGAYVNRICIQDGRIAVVESNCPGGDCIHCGWVGSTGRSIVCLPNGVEIRVVSQDSTVDFAVR